MQTSTTITEPLQDNGAAAYNHQTAFYLQEYPNLIEEFSRLRSQHGSFKPYSNAIGQIMAFAINDLQTTAQDSEYLLPDIAALSVLFGFFTRLEDEYLKPSDFQEIEGQRDRVRYFISRLYRPGTKEENDLFLTPSEIVEILKKESTFNMDFNPFIIMKVLKALGFEIVCFSPKKSNEVYKGYYLNKIIS